MVTVSENTQGQCGVEENPGEAYTMSMVDQAPPLPDGEDLPTSQLGATRGATTRTMVAGYYSTVQYDDGFFSDTHHFFWFFDGDQTVH